MDISFLELMGAVGAEEDFKLKIHAVRVSRIGERRPAEELRSVVTVLQPDLAELARVVSEVDGDPPALVAKGILRRTVAAVGERIVLALRVIEPESRHPRPSEPPNDLR